MTAAPVGSLPELPTDLQVFLVDFPTPSELDKLQPLPVVDAAIQSLASKSHIQQRQQLLHIHKRKLEEFTRDSNLQWDNGYYVTNRYSQTRYPQSLYVTPEIQRNIDQSNGEDGGNGFSAGPVRRAPDKLSINELQFHLGNQGAVLRRHMSNEYEELREFQNNELKVLLQAKAAKDTEFKGLVEEARRNPQRFMATRIPSKQVRRESLTHLQQQQQQPPPPPARPQQIVQAQSASPVLTHSSPIEHPDLQALRNDPTLSAFFKFFLSLRVVQQNWPAVSPSWSQYIAFFQRKLMTEKAFAKAVIEDAVRRNVAYQFTPDLEYINKTKLLITEIPEGLLSRLIMEVVLEMAEAGDIEANGQPNESEIFGPRIIMDAMRLEAMLQAEANVQQATDQNVGKATDPRNR